MAKNKSAEELMLDAELRASSSPRSQSKGASSSTHKDAVLPEAAPASPKEPSKLAVFFRKPHVLASTLGLFAIVGLLAAGISQAVFSRSTDVWDGTADTSWYVAGMTSMNISTAEQLAGMRKLCNEGTNLKGIQFRLVRNLDLYDIPTKPIGDGRNEQGQVLDFCGSFDGTGHTISGINVVEGTWDHAGLFGSVSGGDISNLTVEGKVTGQVRVGGIVGEMSGGSLTHCTNRCKVSSVKTATSYYPVTADVGGVCGIWLGITAAENEQSATIANLTNEGEVSARACSAGGVIGTIANTNDFTLDVHDLVNNNTVTVYCESDDRDEAVGGVVGVVGQLGTTTYAGLVNNGDVQCSTVLSVGGVFGALMQPQTEEMEEPAGQWSEGVTVRTCKNTAKVLANADDERAHVGGIVGYLNDPEVIFENCENTGELVATNGSADDICSVAGVEVWDTWEDEHPSRYL